MCAGTDLNDLNTCLAMMTRLRWIHSCSAGVEHLVKLPNLARTNDSHLQPLLTNARGVYRFSLAEFVLYSCKYFAMASTNLRRLFPPPVAAARAAAAAAPVAAAAAV